MQDNYVKILFRFHSDIFDEEMKETMWAVVVDSAKGLYKLDNIPFYAPLVASDDIVFAEYDNQEQMLTYRKKIIPVILQFRLYLWTRPVILIQYVVNSNN